jgi:TfoX/Sxy family transcriptional regulator of competence genes
MAWKKVPKENEELLDSLMEAFPEAERRKMFGCPCYFLNGNMFIGAHEENFILRLSEPDQADIFKNEQVTNFTPMGRVMREYVLIPPSMHQSKAEFVHWIDRSKAYAASLPTKEKKVRK